MGLPIPDDVRLKGPFRPMRFEADVPDCIVTEGELPKDLNGGFYRNGPTWRRHTQQGTLGVTTMDGMIQGLIFENGTVNFRNRWIRTEKFVAEEKAGRALFRWGDGKFGDWRDFGYSDVERDEYTKDVSQGTSLVNCFPFDGKLIASGEQGGAPYEIDPITLETKGTVPWSYELSPGAYAPAHPGDNTFSAHPKWDSRTGELYGWTWRDYKPFVTLHWIKPGGVVGSRELWDAPYNSLAHDIWITENYVILPFQPFLVDRQRLKVDRQSIEWNKDLPIVLALIPRNDIHGEVMWVEADIELQYVMHTLAANEHDGKITLDAPIFERPPFPFDDQFKPGDYAALFYSIAPSRLGRWTVDLKTKKVTSEQISDRPAELPKVDERFYARGYEHGFLIGGDLKREGMSMKSVIHWNARTGHENEFRVREDRPAAVLESTFAPRSKDAPEGDGYLMVPVSHWAENLGEYLIFDTYDVSAGPICRIELPFRMGWTAHGHWMGFE